MNSDKWTLIRGARQLLTLHRHSARRGRDLAELGVIVDGSILLHDGVIDAVGPTRRIENMAGARRADEIDASGRVVMPAFVDPQAIVAPAPGAGSDRARVIQSLPASRIEAQADRLLRTIGRHGTATLASLTGWGGDLTGELKILRALHARHKKPLDVVSVLQLTGDPDPSVNEELMSTVARRKLAGIVAVRSGTGGFAAGAAMAMLRAARSLGLDVRLELLPDHDLHLAATAVELHALSVTFAGRCRIPEIEMLAESSTTAILLPELLPPGCSTTARELIENGALLALGTGLNPATGGTASMQMVIQAACVRGGLTVEEAISASTVNAAWAIGMGSVTGSLEHGKSGDVLLLDVSDYRDLSLFTGTNLVHTMIKRGIVLFEEDFSGWPRPSH